MWLYLLISFAMILLRHRELRKGLCVHTLAILPTLCTVTFVCICACVHMCVYVCVHVCVHEHQCGHTHVGICLDVATVTPLM